jgi:SEC-C motif-containing protein
MKKLKSCNCGSAKTYAICCGKIHLKHESALTAEELMRSRYTAFTLADGSFLTKTHHSSTRNPKEEKEIVSWSKSVQWIRLEILNCTKGTSMDTEGTVEFKAYFYENGEVQRIHENSFFRRENNFWFYLGIV